jgi:hypothetical protein
MKLKIVFVFCLTLSSVINAQKLNNWKLDCYQFNAGGVMSTKIPAATYANYDSILSSIYEGALVWGTPKALANLRMRPIFHADVQFFNSKSNATQRFGISLNNRLLTSFLTQYISYPDSVAFPFGAINDLRVDHRSPVLTLDYSYLKKIKVTKQLNFNFGAGVYLGQSLGNRISTFATNTTSYGVVFAFENYSTSDIMARGSSIGNFAKHNFNAGIYASFGLEYSLHDKQAENHRWFITYENRICYDFFAVKNVPSSWFSFQSANMFGLKYYLNRK